MKLLDGSELTSFIKERQARQVRALRQADGVFPKLVILRTSDNQVIDTYVRLKSKYGKDILIDVEICHVTDGELLHTIETKNNDENIHGIIVQLPLADTSITDEALNRVAPEKDVDGLGSMSKFTPATPMAIDWLVAGYNVTLRDRDIAIVGRGKLVGGPLEKLWRAAGYNVRSYTKADGDISEQLRTADVVVTAAGSPGLITVEHLKPNAVVLDAATASEDGKIIGDVADEVRHSRDDLTITPVKGGVGPLTVAALFDNVIRAARSTIET